MGPRSQALFPRLLGKTGHIFLSKNGFTVSSEFSSLPSPASPRLPMRFIRLSELTLWGSCGLMLNFIPEKQTERTVLAVEVSRGPQGPPAYRLLTVGARAGKGSSGGWEERRGTVQMPLPSHTHAASGSAAETWSHWLPADARCWVSHLLMRPSRGSRGTLPKGARIPAQWSTQEPHSLPPPHTFIKSWGRALREDLSIFSLYPVLALAFLCLKMTHSYPYLGTQAWEWNTLFPLRLGPPHWLQKVPSPRHLLCGLGHLSWSWGSWLSWLHLQRAEERPAQ